VVPGLVSYIVPNGAALQFQPLLEVVVVLTDEAVIKLLVALNSLQGDGYSGVGRGRSLFPPASWTWA